jgi:acetyl-CoA carboxylase biotin carboxyl carrier protein
MDIAQIKKLIQLLNDNNLGEIKVQDGDLKITLRHKDFRKSAAVNASSVPIAQTTAIAAAPIISQNNTETAAINVSTFKAPMIGTFYRSSSPDKEAFVKVGDVVKKGQVLCVIEAMKLFNEVQSEISGKIVKVLVDNSQAVEYDQPLFLIELN